MKAILTVAGRELAGLFGSPLAWLLIAAVQAILGYLFLAQVDAFLKVQPSLAATAGAPGVTDLIIGPYFTNAAAVLLVVAPFLGMRTISEELRSGSFSLLRSAPLGNTQITIGKYLGLYLFYLAVALLLALPPLLLQTGTDLDLGKFAAVLLGLMLLLSLFASAGVFASSLTPQPGLAATITFALLFVLWILDWAGNHTPQASQALAHLSSFSHFRNLSTGLVDTHDLAYFALISIAFLGLTVRQLEAQRLQR
ncbi:MAG: ABC transporter permease [Chromatiales bacterium]|nr:ABC transporter permease [Chromatiales bacterium]